jgi:predicted Zn-dependent protease with MMP-like domain
MIRLSSDQFDRLVIEALETLPPFFQEVMSNVELVVEDWPSREQMGSLAHGGMLLGLYEGIPLTERYNYNLVPPDVITLFQRPLEQSAHSLDELRQEVRHTVIHEIAHHFGIDDDRLVELGAY